MDAGLRVIGVNADSTREKGRLAAIEKNVRWRNLYEGERGRFSKQLGIESWPALFLLDANGIIVSSDKQMRMVTFVEMEDSTIQDKHYLDWTLEHLFAVSPSKSE